MPLAIALTLASAGGAVWQVAAAQSTSPEAQTQQQQSWQMSHDAMRAPSFASLDTDHNGTISRQEATAFPALEQDFDNIVGDQGNGSDNQDSDDSQAMSSDASTTGITRSEYQEWKRDHYPKSGQSG